SSPPPPAHRDLHSFPTRRSSDLDEGASGLPLAVQAMTAMREERVGRQPVANRSASATTLTSDAHEFLLEDKATESGEYFGFRGLDRKSTRLNSSHVSISYAVFCL